MEMSGIQNQPEYQEAIQLVNKNYDRLSQELSDSQQKQLMRYAESRNELSNIIELDIFRTGFRLGAQIIIEVLKK